MPIPRASQTRVLFLAVLLTVSVAALWRAAGGQNGSRLYVQKTPPPPRHIRAATLPAPYATPSVDTHPRVGPRPRGATLSVPPGFQIEAWASGLNNPRFLTVAPNGDVFVAESAADRVTVLRSTAGRPPIRSHFATGLRQPFGIAFYPPGPNPSAIYIANTDAVVRFPYRNGDLKARGAGKTLIHLPGGGYNQHWTRTLLFSPDGKRLYVAVGSRSNVGIEAPPRACIMEYDPDGTHGRIFASGLRNAVGLTTNPITGALWAAVNERDEIGNDVPPDYATHVKPGGFYGWPYYYIGGHHDPRMPQRPELKNKTIVPDVLLEAHCAALSIVFYTAAQFPAQYKNEGFVALHGSWNRRPPNGYKVVRVLMRPDGTAQGSYQDFVWGWKTADNRIWGRPVALAITKDGALLISDDGGNKIWRVRYRQTARAASRTEG